MKTKLKIQPTKEMKQKKKRNGETLGSKLGYRKDRKKREELSNSALSSDETVCKKKWKTKQQAKPHLYESFVKTILFFNWPQDY